MIFRVRDLISAFMLLPLCFAGLILGLTATGLFGGLTADPATPMPSTIASRTADDGGVVEMIILVLVCLAIPIAYFWYALKQRRDNPNRVYFGELSSTTYLVLAGIAFALPLVGGVVLGTMF